MVAIQVKNRVELTVTWPPAIGGTDAKVTVFDGEVEIKVTTYGYAERVRFPVSRLEGIMEALQQALKAANAERSTT